MVQGPESAPGQARFPELVAGQIFRHLVEHAYQPGEPGSIAVALDEKGQGCA